MTFTEINAENVLTAENALPKDSPVVMLNLVRYNAQADYGDRAGVAPCSGQEAYLQRYAPAFNRVAAANGVRGIQVLYAGFIKALVVGPAEEAWDDIALVEYPSFAAFRRVSESREYQEEAVYHRRAALQDWRLIATVKMAAPG